MPLFLSEAWIAAAQKVQEETTDLPEAPVRVRMNLDVYEIPTDISAAEIPAHLDTSDGGLELDVGHLDAPEIAIRIDYVTAKAILVDGNSQAGVNAYMAGKVRLLTGDLAKLMGVAQGIEKMVSPAVAQRLKDITD